MKGYEEARSLFVESMSLLDILNSTPKVIYNLEADLGLDFNDRRKFYATIWWAKNFHYDWADSYNWYGAYYISGAWGWGSVGVFPFTFLWDVATSPTWDYEMTSETWSLDTRLTARYSVLQKISKPACLKHIAYS